MRKTLLFGVFPVGKFTDACGFVETLYLDVKNTLVGGVYKVGVFYQDFADFVQVFTHRQNPSFTEVIQDFIPTIHTTYNKLQLININIVTNRLGG